MRHPEHFYRRVLDWIGTYPGVRPQDVVGGMDWLTPGFLADQIGRSRAHLGVARVPPLPRDQYLRLYQ